MRYASAYVLPFLALCAPLNAQSGEELPRSAGRGSTAGLEVYTAAEFQQFELDDGQEIEKVSVPVTARLTAGRVRVTAQVPYVRVSGPDNVVAPSGPLGLPIFVDPTRPPDVRTREGLGDARVAVAYDVGIPEVNV